MKKLLIVIALVAMNMSLLAQRIEIMGAGATFPLPFYSRIFEEYSRTHDRVNYQGIGSGGGINQLIAQTVDFGGTDAVVAKDVEDRSGGTILHIPTCMGAVVVTYNVPLANNVKLKFTSDLIADIFMGNITNWNDRRIAAINPGVSLPRLPITVVYRSDASGTTSIFTDYLTRTNKTWADRIGHGTSVSWPTGIGSRGNPGVAGTVSQTRGAIGYVELIYALSNDIAFADVRNKAGKFITPNIESVSNAAAVSIPADAKLSLVDTDHPDGYPISGFTWVILFREQNFNNRPIERARATVNLIRWMINEGQAYAEELHYAPLSDEARKVGEELLKSVTFGGQSL